MKALPECSTAINNSMHAVLNVVSTLCYTDVSAGDVKSLCQQTGAGIMDCKKAYWLSAVP